MNEELVEDVMIPVKQSDMDKSILKEIEEYMGENISNLFHLPARPFVPYVYSEDFIWLPLLHLDLSQWKNMRLREFVEKRREENQQWLTQKKFERLLSLSEKAIKINMYLKYFSQIPDENKYDLFRYVYQYSEFGFDQFEKDMLLRIFSYRTYSESWKERILALQQFADEDGMLTVFRGQGTRSTELSNAMSWTLNRNVAKFFAHRFSNNGVIYKAKAPIDAIYDYLTERNEEEILVEYTSLLDIREL